MSIQPSSRRLASAALPLAGLLALSLVAPPRLSAGEDHPRPKACGTCPARSGAAPRASDARLMQVTYQVADLVIPVPDVVSVSTRPACAAPPAAAATREDRLIQLITSTVEPNSWSGKGGAGTIDYHPLTMGLVVCQTPDVQEQVADMLAALRRKQNTEVALEVRVLSVDESFLGRLDLGGRDDTGGKADSSASPKRVTFLNDEQLRRLLEDVQGDVRANVMQAPKMTLFDGQTCVLDATQPEEFVTGVDIRVGPNGNPVITPKMEKVPFGVHMNLEPTVSADRRFVRVKMNVDLSQLEEPKADLIPVQVPTGAAGPDGDAPKSIMQLIERPRISRLAVDTTCNVPDGGTALISGLTRERIVRTEYGPPVLSDIPYLNRLFKNVGYAREKECVLLLVTPRIIVPTEEEEKVAGKTETAPPDAVRQCAAPVCGKHEQAAELVAKYNQACAEGHMAEATQLAVQALAMDPTCFHADGRAPAAFQTSAPQR